jgi:hypothetical protein
LIHDLAVGIDEQGAVGVAPMILDRRHGEETLLINKQLSKKLESKTFRTEVQAKVPDL